MYNWTGWFGSSGFRWMLTAVCLVEMAGRVHADEKPATSQPHPAVKQIISDYYKASGGRAAREKMHDRITKGTMTIITKNGRGGRGPFTRYDRRPDNLYFIWEPKGGGVFDNGTNGTVAWEITPTGGPRIMEGLEQASMTRHSTFNFELHWADLYPKITFGGIEQFENKSCYKLVMTPKKGKPEARYFDKETKLLIGERLTLSTGDREYETVVVYDKYHTVDGVLMPHRITQRFKTHGQLVEIDSIRHNADIPDSRFELPAVIRVLQSEKRAKPPEKKELSDKQTP
ncbi:MAG: hypothetical protein ACE5F9_08045 [Phycisphaerae bacterium]